MGVAALCGLGVQTEQGAKEEASSLPGLPDYPCGQLPHTPSPHLPSHDGPHALTR